MEFADNQLNELSGILMQTLSHNLEERREAERLLRRFEGSREYPLMLLSLINNADIPIHIRISASVTFKNFIKRNWAVLDDDPNSNRIHPDTREIIKQHIVSLMLRSPEQIQKLLSDAITCIGKEDFPGNWPNLLQEMIEKLQTDDLNIIVGILHTAYSIFKRYRHEFQSEKLWKEIKFVLDEFSAPFTSLSGRMLQLTKSNAGNVQNMKLLYGSLVLISKIFYCLNFQDLPEFFEDNMATWMAYFHEFLNADVSVLSADDEPGVIEHLKTQVCDILAMYAQKYADEFSSYLPDFVRDVWHLLINTSVHVKYDLLVSNAIQFLASVADKPTYKHLFEDPSTLASICEKVIVPNMEFRDADEESFEDNPEEYIKRDMEGSDTETRRRAACDLVRALSKSFEEVVIQNFSVYIQHMLQLYQQDPKKNWKSKDAAIFLVTSLATKAQTQKHGITQISQLVNVLEFFTNHIVTELNAPSANESAVLKSDAIKYVMVFRNQLPREALLASWPLLVNNLAASSHVVHSYAACCIEKLLLLKPPVILKSDISPMKEALLGNLFGALQKPGSQENEYIMRAIMRCLNLLQEDFTPFVPNIVPQIFEKLVVVSKNPSKPNFNHSLFESLCVVIVVSCKSFPGEQVISSFEQPLFPLFEEMLKNNVQEFVPYIFQVLSLTLEMHTNVIPAPYMNLFPLLLTPEIWQVPGNVPALVRILQAFVCIGMSSNQIVPDQVEKMLGVFQKLLSSRTNHHFGFQLLSSLIVHVPHNLMSPYLQHLFNLLFQKLRVSRTTKYVHGLMAFFSLFCIRYSPSSLIQIVESVEVGLFEKVVESILIVEATKVDLRDRKLCAVGLTKILCEPLFVSDAKYSKLWLLLLESLIGLLECPMTDSNAKGDNQLAVEQTPAEEFQATYVQLQYASKKEVDYCADVVDPKIFFAQSLHVHATSAEIAPKLSELQLNMRQLLQQYFNLAGIVA